MNLREIDRLVAEKVLGWKQTPYGWDVPEKKYNLGIEWDLPKFSTNIADAWQVIEKMKQAKFSARHRFVTELQKEVTPKELKDKKQLLDLGWMIFFLTPKDICIAALKSVGVNIE